MTYADKKDIEEAVANGVASGITYVIFGFLIAGFVLFIVAACIGGATGDWSVFEKDPQPVYVVEAPEDPEPWDLGEGAGEGE